MTFMRFDVIITTNEDEIVVCFPVDSIATNGAKYVFMCGPAVMSRSIGRPSFSHNFVLLEVLIFSVQSPERYCLQYNHQIDAAERTLCILRKLRRRVQDAYRIGSN